MYRYVLGFFQAFYMSLQILIIDFLPLSVKRKLMNKEYTGDALEERIRTKIFGGLKMFNLLWTVSMSQHKLQVGDTLPENIKVYDVINEKMIKLAELAQPGVPLIMNFGSCT